MLQQTNQLSWATGPMRDLYVAADARGNHVWRVCRAEGKEPAEITPDDCHPLASFRAPGITVPNMFSNRTEALRVSEHFCRLIGSRTESGSWGCWRWTGSQGRKVLQLCVPFPLEKTSMVGDLSSDTSPIIGLPPRPSPDTTLGSISSKIVHAANDVYRDLRIPGAGKLIEKDYHMALANRLSEDGFRVDRFYSVPVAGASARELDILVNNHVILEVKKENWAAPALKWRNYIQGYCYCAIGKLPLCLVINFAPPAPETMWVTEHDEVTVA
jgi:GxxExxY protein